MKFLQDLYVGSLALLGSGEQDPATELAEVSSDFTIKWFYLLPLVPDGQGPNFQGFLDEYDGLDPLMKAMARSQGELGNNICYISELAGEGKVCWEKGTKDIPTNGTSLDIPPVDSITDLITSQLGEGGILYEGWALGWISPVPIINDGSEEEAPHMRVSANLHVGGTSSYIHQRVKYVGDKYSEDIMHRTITFDTDDSLSRVLAVRLSIGRDVTVNMSTRNPIDSKRIVISPYDLQLPTLMGGRPQGPVGVTIRAAGEEDMYVGTVSVSWIHGQDEDNISEINCAGEQSIALLRNHHYPVAVNCPSLPKDVFDDVVSGDQFLGIRVTAVESADGPKTDVDDYHLKIGTASSGDWDTVGVIHTLPEFTGDPYCMTFHDYDGSVQHAAVVPAIHATTFDARTHCAEFDLLPIIFATHGAGVKAFKPAWTGAYDQQNCTWILEPTNRRQFGWDWEEFGALNGVMALEAFTQHISENADTLQPVDPQNLFFSGHSMGGHGCFVFSTLMTDHGSAALCAAGWTKMDSYPGSMFWDADGRSSDQLKAVFGSVKNQWATDLNSVHLHELPFAVRYGSVDDNVSVWYPRRMARLASEVNGEPFWSAVMEAKGESHWFDGVLNAMEVTFWITHYIKNARSFWVEHRNSDSPDTQVCKDADNVYAMPRTWTVKSTSHGWGQGRHGIYIMSNKIIGKEASIVVENEKGSAYLLKPANVNTFVMIPPCQSHDAIVTVRSHPVQGPITVGAGEMLVCTNAARRCQLLPLDMTALGPQDLGRPGRRPVAIPVDHQPMVDSLYGMITMVVPGKLFGSDGKDPQPAIDVGADGSVESRSSGAADSFNRRSQKAYLEIGRYMADALFHQIGQRVAFVGSRDEVAVGAQVNGPASSVKVHFGCPENDNSWDMDTNGDIALHLWLKGSNGDIFKLGKFGAFATILPPGSMTDWDEGGLLICLGIKAVDKHGTKESVLNQLTGLLPINPGRGSPDFVVIGNEGHVTAAGFWSHDGKVQVETSFINAQ
eukprot:Clim_evm17s2 gene=Clim_evmTU17s2